MRLLVYHNHQSLWRMHQWWLNLSRWVLVKALMKLWLALAIDFSLEWVGSLKFAVHCAKHCGKAIKLKSFLLLQIQRLTNNSSFSAPINMTQTSSLFTAIFSLSSTDWNELQCFEGPHALIVRMWTNLVEWREVFFQASHIKVSLQHGAKGQYPRSTWNGSSGGV